MAGVLPCGHAQRSCPPASLPACTTIHLTTCANSMSTRPHTCPSASPGGSGGRCMAGPPPCSAGTRPQLLRARSSTASAGQARQRGQLARVQMLAEGRSQQVQQQLRKLQHPASQPLQQQQRPTAAANSGQQLSGTALANSPTGHSCTLCSGTGCAFGHAAHRPVSTTHHQHGSKNKLWAAEFTRSHPPAPSPPAAPGPASAPG